MWAETPSQYKGEILTDITSFSVVQPLIENPNEASLFQLMNLESIIETFLFHEKILIVGPTYFGSKFTVPVPQLLQDLIDKKIVEVYNPSFCSGKDDFIRLCKETYNFLDSENISAFYSKHKEIEKEINSYTTYVNYGKQEGSIKLASYFGVTNEHEINLMAHLLRTYIHFKCLHEIENWKKRKISYSPHMARTTLVEEMCNRYENRMKPIARRLMEQMNISDKEIETYYNEIYGSQFILNIPILMPWVLSQCRRTEDILDELLILRDENEVRKYRKWCTGFQNAIYNCDKDKINKYHNEFKTIEAMLRTQKMRSVIPIDFSIADDNTLGITGSGIISNALGYIWNTWKTRDLVLLNSVKARSDSIGYSKEKFEGEFKIKLKY
jgi:hypothetical protein